MRRRDAHRDDQWALILAGGEGTRLRSLTRRISGEERPNARLSPSDFSADVLAQNPVHLAVLPVTGISWTDLGQPRRVFAVLRALGLRPAWAVERSAESA